VEVVEHEMGDYPVHLDQHHATTPNIQHQGEDTGLSGDIDEAQDHLEGAVLLVFVLSQNNKL